MSLAGFQAAGPAWHSLACCLRSVQVGNRQGQGKIRQQFRQGILPAVFREVYLRLTKRGSFRSQEGLRQGIALVLSGPRMMAGK